MISADEDSPLPSHLDSVGIVDFNAINNGRHPIGFRSLDVAMAQGLPE